LDRFNSERGALSTGLKPIKYTLHALRQRGSKDATMPANSCILDRNKRVEICQPKGVDDEELEIGTKKPQTNPFMDV